MPLISVSGTQGIGKTTFIQDFLEEWPMYRTPEKSYRDLIREKGLVINQNAGKETQLIILDSCIEVIENLSKADNYIIDRNPIDNLAYSIWLGVNKPESGIDDEFLKESVQRYKKAVRKLDLIFFIPLVESHKIQLVKDELRDDDPKFQRDIDVIFKNLKKMRDENDDFYFIKDDSPPMIEIFGSREERIEMAKLYIKSNGSFYGENESMIYDAMGNFTDELQFSEDDTKEKESLLNRVGANDDSLDDLKIKKDNVIKFPPLSDK